jgi:hypothetical protein
MIGRFFDDVNLRKKLINKKPPAPLGATAVGK